MPLGLTMKNGIDRIGLIAGKGMLPEVIARKLSSGGAEVYSVGFRRITGRGLKKYVRELEYIRLGELQPIIYYLKARQVQKAVVCGLVKHRKIFDGLEMDDAAKKMFASMKDRRADSILGVFAGELKKEGIELLSAADIIPENLLGGGLLTRQGPDSAQGADIEFGYMIAKGVAGMDIGQTVVVKDRAVVAVEGIEGTDRCILRAGELAGRGCVAVKVSKPEQDMRFDMPVIGMKTVNSMKKARASVLAVEAGKAIILEKEKVIKEAGRNNIIITGIEPE